MLKQIKAMDWKAEESVKNKVIKACSFDSDEVIIVFDDCFVCLTAYGEGECYDETYGYMTDANISLDGGDPWYSNYVEPSQKYVDLGILTQEEYDKFDKERREIKNKTEKERLLKEFEELKAKLNL